MLTLSVTSRKREELIDITQDVQDMVSEKSWGEGALLLYCPHTTGAVTVNEGADPAVARDIAVNLGKLIPHKDDYRHAEGNSDAHIKSSLTGCGQLLPVSGGEVRLSTWQRVFFCEYDGPRSRRLWVQWLPGEDG
ncbi:secondary thiamine-phosphate synthase enzyme YjbQ [Desulfohalovibrio reitneri]|uniref:secondary thiamine-phosphate synthase enzyme YjbQ n=1 Tax=Desulfohalovibrio reitneri TaxID=1307759 RepID=UPI0004A74388|nr:secondary thiamine-phosphate synthase enzyme YjbQ [Desulfohalovibrio reitneri]